MPDAAFNFPRAQRDAQKLSEFIATRLTYLAAEGGQTRRYADAISVMDPADAITLLWLFVTDESTISALPPLE